MILVYKDGTRKEATKDCTCITHDGPHWMHEDRLWYKRNLEYMPLHPLVFCKVECERLTHLEATMNLMCIVEIVEGGGRLNDDHKTRRIAPRVAQWQPSLQ